MYYTGIVKDDYANGEDIGVALFVAGCDLHCNNGDCHGKDFYDFSCGKEFSRETEKEIFSIFEENPYYGRLTLTGGNPTSGNNPIVLSNFVGNFKKRFPNVLIWVYSGYTLEEIEAIPEAYELVKKCDVLVDGRWYPELHSLKLKYVGSSNQRIIDIQKSLRNKKIILYMENK